RVQQTYKHSVPRFFVPEHGTMFTLALVRFPPTATKEIQYLNAKGALTYTDIAGDPVLYGNLPPREISMKDVFRSGDSSRSEERFSRNAETDLVCRLLLEKKKKQGDGQQLIRKLWLSSDAVHVAVKVDLPP